MRKMTTPQVIDHAITSTTSRTIITHGSTQMMVLSMLIFGGPTLHYFAVALTIGILFGIYSSIFVAAGIAMWLGVKREDFVKVGAKDKEVDPERSLTPGRWCRVKSHHDPHESTDPAAAMATGESPLNLASQARRLYTEELVKGLVAMVQATLDSARALLDKPAEHQAQQRRRDLVQALMSRGPNLAPRHRQRPAPSDAGRWRVGLAPGRLAAAGQCRQPLVAGGRRHHRARDRHLAAGVGHHGPRQLGVRRPAFARGPPGRPRRTRPARHAARACAGPCACSKPGAPPA